MRAATTCATLLLIALGPCTASAGARYRPVPEGRIIEMPTAPTDVAEAATIHVGRPGAAVGMAMLTVLTVDGNEVARIRSGEEISIRLAPGEHLLGLKFLDNDPVAGALTLGLARPKRWHEQAAILEAGKTYNYRIEYNSTWEWQLNRTSEP